MNNILPKWLQATPLPDGDAAAAAARGESHPLFQALDPNAFPPEELQAERLFGLENFGANSVIQALFFCGPFREYVSTALEQTPVAPVLSVHNLKDQQHQQQPPEPNGQQHPVGNPLARRNSPAKLPQPPTQSQNSQPASPAAAAAASPHTPPLPLSESPALTSDQGDTKQDSGLNPSLPSQPSPSDAPASAAVAPSSPDPQHPQQPTQNGGNHLLPPGPAPLPGQQSRQPRFERSTMLTTLRDLFLAMAKHQDRTGVLAPEAFITQLRRENELFRTTMHQDAHEFLNYLLNAVAEEADQEQQAQENGSHQASTAASSSSNVQEQVHPDQHNGLEVAAKEDGKAVKSNGYCHRENGKPMQENGKDMSWVHQLFGGTLTNETLCLNCKNISSRDETFLDLSLDIEENSSVTSCLRQFSASEKLECKNRFHCDACSSLQDAERRMKIKHSPDVLSLHLKRFKWQENVQKFTKLSYRVVFPFELRLFNTVDDSPDLDRLYHLWAIVVHVGAGPYHGHYITIVKSMGRWLLFDDENITQIDEADISKYYGDTPGSGSGYVLFYQAADIANPQPKATPAPQEEKLSEWESLEPDVVTPLASSTMDDSSRPSSKAKAGLDSPTKEKRSFFSLPSRRSLSSRQISTDAQRPTTAPEVQPPPAPSEPASLSSSVDLSDSSASSQMQPAWRTGGAPPLKMDLSSIPPPPPITDPSSSAANSPTTGSEKRSFGRFFTRSKSSRSVAPTPVSEQPPPAHQAESQQNLLPHSGPSASDMPSLSYDSRPSTANSALTASTNSMGRKELKTQAKEQQKREKEEAKRRKEEAKAEAKKMKRQRSTTTGTSSSDRS